MLISQNAKCGALSIYECDRCKRQVERPKIWQLKAGLNGKDYKMICHLCEKCFRALQRGIKNYDKEKS